MSTSERTFVRIVIEINAPTESSSLERRPGDRPPSPDLRGEDGVDPGTEGVPVRCLVVEGDSVGDGITVYLKGNAPLGGQEVEIFYDGQRPIDPQSQRRVAHREPVKTWSSQTWGAKRKAAGAVSAQSIVDGTAYGPIVDLICPE